MGLEQRIGIGNFMDGRTDRDVLSECSGRVDNKGVVLSFRMGENVKLMEFIVSGLGSLIKRCIVDSDVNW
jgi:hypothetical protein